MPRRSDTVFFKNLNDKQIKTLINQLSHIKKYNEFIDYVYDETINNSQSFAPNTFVLIDSKSIYYSTLKSYYKNQLYVIGKILHPIFIKEHYYLVEIHTDKETYQLEIYYNYISHIKII